MIQAARGTGTRPSLAAAQGQTIEITGTWLGSADKVSNFLVSALSADELLEGALLAYFSSKRARDGCKVEGFVRSG